MLKRTLLISTVAALFLAGCASSTDSTTTDTVPVSYTDITVERGPVHGALAIDGSGKIATFVGDGKYRFAGNVVYPVTIDGGYIDVNRNGEIDAGEVALKYTLKTQQGTVATMVSTIASNIEVRAMLKNEFGLTDEEIDTQTPGINKVIAAISDELYAYSEESGLSPAKLTLTEMTQIKERVRNRINLYQGSDQSVAQLEETLMTELEIKALAASNLPSVDQHINQSGVADSVLTNSSTVGDLSDAQREALLFMAEEEKVARDTYEYLYSVWGVDIFANIARSEQKHMDAVVNLLEKYSIQLPSTLESRGGFENTELQALYDNLIEKGKLSLVDALEVGVAVEETDIADLEEILKGDLPKDLKTVYTNLLNGSYKHLNAFSGLLLTKQQ